MTIFVNDILTFKGQKENTTIHMILGGEDGNSNRYSCVIESFLLPSVQNM